MNEWDPLKQSLNKHVWLVKENRPQDKWKNWVQWVVFCQDDNFLICKCQSSCWVKPEVEPPPSPPLYLLMRHVANGDVLRFVVDGVEGFVGLQAESGDGQEDEEEWAKGHILQRERNRAKKRVTICTTSIHHLLLIKQHYRKHACTSTFLWPV